jgi:hypothetical protein
MRWLALVLVGMFALTGCGDDRTCLRSHEEQRTTLMLVGKVTVPVTYPVTVCDEYAA